MSEKKKIDFSDLEPQFEEFQFCDVKYRVKEAHSDAVVKYRKEAARHFVYRNDTITGNPGEMAGAEPLLVSMCVVRLDADNPNMEHPVKLDQIKNWPNRLTSRLFDWIMENSDMRLAQEKKGDDKKSDEEKAMEAAIESADESLEEDDPKG